MLGSLDSSTASQDQHRLQSLLADRRTTSQEFFSSSAGQWDRLREELFGDRFHLAALAGLADPGWVVGDFGCGTGQVSAALAPFVARIVAVTCGSSTRTVVNERLDVALAAGADGVHLRQRRNANECN